MSAAALNGQVVVIGSANLDLTVTAPRLPREGETVLGGDLLLSSGGKGANQAVAALKAGADVRILAKVGRDPFGDRICRDLSATGLPTDGLLRDESASTGVALIVVDREGRNQIAVAPGSNQLLLPSDIEQHEPFLARGNVVLVQLEIPIATVEHAVRFARTYGMTTILNPAPPLPLTDDLLHQIDLLTPNETEAEALTGIAISDVPGAAAAAKALLVRGPHVVIITLGPKGALLCTAAASRHLPAVPIEAVDTTAAGDAFNGALVAALAATPRADLLREDQIGVLEEAVRFANAAGALATTRRGAQESLPTRADIEALLASRPHEDPSPQ